MPNTDTKKVVSLSPAPHSFPVQELIETGIWAAIGHTGRAILPVLWDYYRRFPLACHPSRETLTRLTGISHTSVSKAVQTLEEIGLVKVIRDGVRANTYRFCWDSITFVPKEHKPRAKSPFAGGTREILDHSYYDQRGRYRGG